MHKARTPNDERTRRRRERILDAAFHVFSRAGYRDAAVDDIAREAETSKGGIYFHFPTREHVLLELIRRDEDYLADELGRFLDTRRDLETVLNEIVRLVLALESRWGAAQSMERIPVRTCRPFTIYKYSSPHQLAF